MVVSRPSNMLVYLRDKAGGIETDKQRKKDRVCACVSECASMCVSMD